MKPILWIIRIFPNREIFNKIAHVVGVTSPKYIFPPFLIKALGLVISIKAIDELNLPQTSIEEAIREAYIWFKDNGYL